MDRYARQSVFSKIGVEGQRTLAKSRVAIVGAGALGTVSAAELAGAGVGFLRLIDRDYVELTNLQRQTLFDEADAREGSPKAVAAAERLRKINSEIVIEPIVADFNAANAEKLTSDVDVVIDGSDNAAARYLLNDVCRKLGLPWVYGGALGSVGAAMSFMPDGPCFRCLFQHAQNGGESCATVGVLNMLTGIVGSLQAADALKILLKSPELDRRYRTFDIWNNEFDAIEVSQNLDCPCCGHGDFEFLNAPPSDNAVSLCGRDAYQVAGRRVADDNINLTLLAEKLNPLGNVRLNSFMLVFESASVSFTLFPDGRAIVKNVKSAPAALSVYAEYIGA
ncbi:MAG: ThiF family adenylyltransferase [Oscillospiraceae bacterium]|jgi:adenylyltransferase/sulfurtransferase|nr:ThiF family adenylyltransferase [Oscillospiraceae bacterium]